MPSTLRATKALKPERLSDPVDRLIAAIITAVPAIDEDNLCYLVDEAIRHCGSPKAAAEVVIAGLESGEITLKPAN